MTSVLITIVALWLTQRLLGIWQMLRFRRQLADLRGLGRSSVGMAKRRGRRVYVGLSFDPEGTVTHGLVLRGITVFAVGQREQRFSGLTAQTLASGHVPEGVPKLVKEAAAQAAMFMDSALRRSVSTTPAAA